MTPLTNTERQRLAAILGMLGSAHAGERAAAALQAEAFRHKHGLTWGEVLANEQAAQAEEVSEPEPEPPVWTPAPKPAPVASAWDDIKCASAAPWVVFNAIFWVGILWAAASWLVG